MAGHPAADEEQVLLRVDPHQLEVEGAHARVPHPPRHADALDDLARIGAGTDLASRGLAARLEAAAGVPVNVSNRVGGAGVTGHSAGAQANPDGYTILTITVEVAMMHWRGLTDVTYEDYAPLCLFNRDPSALFVRADSDWPTLADLRAPLEDHPDSLRASGTALWGIWHLACAAPGSP